MANKPLPPIAHGPITPNTPSVQVTAVAPGATVDILLAGTTTTKGSAASINGGTLWVPVSGTLSVGQTVTARQSTPSGTSDESAQPITVIAVPRPSAPVFISPLSTCMSMLKLSGLEPGATVTVRQGASIVGKTTATQTSDFVHIDASAFLTAALPLEAIQEITVSGTTLTSPTASSLPIEGTNREQHLPPPGIGQPVTACRTSLDFFGMTPSADVVVENGGNSDEWLNIASAYNGWGASPFKQGKLVAKQRFPRCKQESAETTVMIGPAKPPGQPVIQANPCPKLRKVRLTGLEPNAVVVLFTVVKHPDGTQTFAPVLGEATASSGSEEFDLPLGVEPVTNTGEAVLLVAHQILCDLVSPDAVPVSFATPGGPFDPPKITGPVYACARWLRVTGAHPSSLLQPFDADGTPIGDAVLAAAADATLKVWFPLAARHKVRIRQVGCNADGDSHPDEPVNDLPRRLPVPKIAEPVRPGAAVIVVKDCLPGARIHLLVNNAVRRSVDTLDATTTIPTADLGLAHKDALWVIQTLCAEQSTGEGVPTVVQRGNLTLDVQPPGNIVRGTTENVTVTAKDADTAALITGAQVFLNGTLVGQTGVAFAFSPVLNQPNPTGVVKDSPAHNDASFSLSLVDPPQKPKGRLFLNLGGLNGDWLVVGSLRLVSATWTVKTVWTPVQTFTANMAHTSITLPDPPPTPADRRISVVLDTTWEVAGYINGTYYPYKTFPGILNPNPTLLAWTGTDLTAGWLASLDFTSDANGTPRLNVTIGFVGAQ